ncbi:MAG: polyphosphate polymerase domain-containing protein [Flavobacteriales bacterium]|nr:polyphosphate polymerase domain-containing protein [Flavobacteriales bacterium]
MINEVQEKLIELDSISLKDMDKVALMNRTDTKFIFNTDTLIGALSKLKKYYSILEIQGKRTANYRTQYFDTEQRDLFIRHQNGKKNRYKIRIRKYIDSDLCFLEVKFKSNKSRTIKNRIKIADFEANLSQTSKDFIRENSSLDPDTLVSTLWNNFSRLTLVSKTSRERLTIDLELAFENNSKKTLNQLVIAEVKREGNAPSEFIKIIKEKHIRPGSMSKYCVGSVLLDDTIKYNNFKPNLLAIKKLTNGLTA